MLIVLCGIKNSLNFIANVQTDFVPFNTALADHPTITGGVIVPIFLGTLDDLPDGCFRPVMKQVYEDICEALNRMHNVGYIHCDVKAQNIFRSTSGRYCLGDYDGCCRVTTRVDLSTRIFWPKDLMNAEAAGLLKACPGVDYAMLACTLLYMLGEWTLTDGQQLALYEMRAKVLTLDAVSASVITDCLKKVVY